MTPNEMKRPTVGQQLRGWLVVAVSLAPVISVSVALERFGNYQHVGWALQLLYSVPAAIALGAIIVLVTRLLLRGTPLEAMGVIYPVMYAPIAAFMFVGWINVAFDDAPPRIVTVAVKERIRRTKGQDRIRLQGWDDPNETVDLPDTFHSGPAVRLEVHRGALRLEWVREIIGPW